MAGLLHKAGCAVGVVGSLMIYGIYQERIMTMPFGPEGAEEVFKWSLLLVLCNRLITCVIAVLAILLRDGKDAEIEPVAPIWAYIAVSIANVIATTCQYEALKYVSFPVQTLGKCAKMLPIMVWDLVFQHAKHKPVDWGLALAITAGCTVFLLTGEIKSKVATSGWHASTYGIGLILANLAFDSFTSTFQQKLFRDYSMSIYNQMLYITLCSSVLSALGLFSSGQMPEALAFLARHPELLLPMTLLSVAATVAVLFISYTIRTFGALALATVMTTRQFLSILLSCVLFAHPLTGGQWAGCVLVFGALYCQGSARDSSKQVQQQLLQQQASGGHGEFFGSSSAEAAAAAAAAGAGAGAGAGAAAGVADGKAHVLDVRGRGALVAATAPEREPLLGDAGSTLAGKA